MIAAWLANALKQGCFKLNGKKHNPSFRKQDQDSFPGLCPLNLLPCSCLLTSEFIKGQMELGLLQTLGPSLAARFRKASNPEWHSLASQVGHLHISSAGNVPTPTHIFLNILRNTCTSHVLSHSSGFHQSPTLRSLCYKHSK